jgi:N-acyl-D-aspartate/D-glutamate deacylase
VKREVAVVVAIAALGLGSAQGAGAHSGAEYSVLIRGGTIYDGSGEPGYVGDVAIRGDRIAYVGPDAPGRAARTIDAAGKAVSPGFINMLSWANEDLIADGRGMSETLQGVTLEVMGEGDSMGPWDPRMKRLAVKRQTDIKYPIRWTTLGQYLEYLQHKGVTPNVASFVGATTVRVHELGEKDVDPTREQLRQMRALVRQAMKQGAVGVGSSLIYAPASFAETTELVALASEAAKCGGIYISHMRDEGNKLIEAIDELVQISKESGAPAEIYHYKQAGVKNWGKIDAAIARVNQARASGLRITADMYTYPASATGLDAAFPLWMQDGGVEAWIKRLRDPALRQRAFAEMHRPDADDTAELVTSDPDKVLLIGFKTGELKPLTGKTLGQVARERHKRSEEVAADLIVEDGTRIEVVYFEMSEDNVRREVALPWMSFGSDGESRAPEGVFLKSSTHPRSYGNFVRLLGKYVRDEKVVTMPDAIRRLTALPATNLSLKQRGWLKPGYYADVVIFNPATVQDHATFVEPQQLATGVGEVFVNGVQVVRDGKHTGALPGRFVRGPGWTGWPNARACT